MSSDTAEPSTAAVLIIGNEILSGRTQDANLAFLGKELSAAGVRLAEARVVPDILPEVVAALDALRGRYRYVFTTGGIGPTHDDITVDCVAAAFGVPVIEHPEARAILEAHYGDALNPARLRMARVPEGAGLIENPVSKAPGIKIGNVYVMAGIPKIMQAQFLSIRHELVGGPPIRSRSRAVHLPESRVAAEFEALQARYPTVEMGSYPWQRDGRFGTSLVLRSSDADELEAAAADLDLMLAALGAELAAEEG